MAREVGLQESLINSKEMEMEKKVSGKKEKEEKEEEKVEKRRRRSEYRPTRRSFGASVGFLRMSHSPIRRLLTLKSVPTAAS